MDVMKKVPVREQAPDVRNKNFDEVCLGYNKEEAMEEATRCLNCKNARCVQGCPVSIDIPAFIHQVKEGNIEEAYKIIGKSSALPAVCGRVCPQETQCKVSVLEESRVNQYQLVSLKDLLLTGQERIMLSQRSQQRRKARKLLLSVQVLQDLHVPETLQKWDMT